MATNEINPAHHQELVDACISAAELIHNRYGIRVGEGTPSSEVLEKLIAVLAKTDPNFAEFCGQNPGIDK